MKKEDLLEHVDENEVVALGKEIIRIPSFTTEESNVARFLVEFMGNHGLEAELQELEPGRFQAIGRIRGTGGGKRLMLNGHIDIDPIPMGWPRSPWDPWVENGRLWGGGIFNMKAGITSMTMAAVAVKRAGIPLRGDLVVAAVAGELQAGVGTIHLLDSGEMPDLAIVTEPFGAHNIVTKHAGACEMALHTYGRTRHMSLKEEGVDAIKQMMKLLEALDKLEFSGPRDPELPGLPRFNVGSVIGGHGKELELRGPYYVSDYCRAFIDVRFCLGMTPDGIKKDIEREIARLSAADPDFKCEVEFPPDPSYGIATVWMHPLDVPKDSDVIRTLAQSYSQVTGSEPRIGPPEPAFRGYHGNDTSHLWQRGIPCCLYGPSGDWETWRWSYVDEMTLCAQVLALAAVDICG
ncbi:MAG TPA: M20/M25/M40 family metallo-hydrolase [Vicinamibacteria bacterium]|nr:M20/M25/M40 family metallo-hydrolase [Vicinamibacteria bacterium]